MITKSPKRTKLTAFSIRAQLRITKDVPSTAHNLNAKLALHAHCHKDTREREGQTRFWVLWEIYSEKYMYVVRHMMNLESGLSTYEGTH